MLWRSKTLETGRYIGFLVPLRYSSCAFINARRDPKGASVSREELERNSPRFNTLFPCIPLLCIWAGAGRSHPHVWVKHYVTLHLNLRPAKLSKKMSKSTSTADTLNSYHERATDVRTSYVSYGESNSTSTPVNLFPS